MSGEQSTPFLTRLHALREHYMAVYRSCIEQLADQTPSYFLEPIVAADGRARTGGALATRLDAMVDTAEDPHVAVSITSDDEAVLSQATFDVDGTSLEIGTTAWERCEIRYLGPAEPWQPVLDWYARWFDAEQKRPPGDDGLCGVIHEVSVPRAQQQHVTLHVDFGSAPVEAFVELVRALVEVGASDLRVGLSSE